ncbi:hypothetical protein FQA39_LY07031 [Lamprigera yunnana]|nr:hypothetical protein FQA39_LY07031 [Lamprigera yunnana]
MEISLKKFYENKKKEVRKQKAEERKETILTHGGALPTLRKEPSQDIILGLIDPLTVVGDHNEFDSDSLGVPYVPKKSVDDVIYEISEQDIIINDGIQIATATNVQTENVVSESEPYGSDTDGRTKHLQEHLLGNTWENKQL